MKKSKSVEEKLTPKQRFEEYKFKTLAFINTLRYPNRASAFSVKAYETLPGNIKKPNTISAPELLAIVGTAGQLGKRVELRISGTGDSAQVDFTYVDATAVSIPSELL